MRLARLDELEVKKEGKKPSKSKAVILSNIEIYIPLEEMIDVDKEQDRLEKEIKQLESYAKSIDSKLKNKGFANNAPQEVVDQEKIKLEEANQNPKKLKKELAQL